MKNRRENIIEKKVSRLTATSPILKEREHLLLALYDAHGKEVKILCNEKKDPGIYTFTWSGADSSNSKVGSGIYVVYMQAGGYSEKRKIAVVK